MTKNLVAKISVFLLVLCAWTNPGYAQSYSSNPLTKIDGSGALVNTWNTVDPVTYLTFISATYSDDTVVDLTSVTNVHTGFPRLAVASDSGATTKAACAWKAFDLSTFNTTVQATIATAGGWENTSPYPITISFNDATNIPLDDVQITMSPDGSFINAIWSAYDTTTGSTSIYRNFSSDGGSTWETDPIQVN